MANTNPTDFFGPVIHSYSRAQAIEDGVLVDLNKTNPDEAKIFRFPVACTCEVYESCIALTPAARRACQDEKGRAWDVLWMASQAIKRAGSGSRLAFKVLITRERVRPTLTTLVLVCGPGDDAEPVLTIMFPGQD